MNLKDLITALEAEDPAKICPDGFHNPHSYRGDYMDLAFEPASDITVGAMLQAARSALGTTFQGYKGGDFTMDGYSWCWLSEEGDASGETISALLLRFMLAAGTLPGATDTTAATDSPGVDEAALTAVYRERAHLVAYLASLHPSHIGYTDPDAPDWAVVIIESPGGQLSWHISPADIPLFAHVRRTDRICRGWDGHTTDEKYERLRQLIANTVPLPLDDGPSGPHPTRQQIHDHAEQQVRAAARRLRASVGFRVLDALDPQDAS